MTILERFSRFTHKRYILSGGSVPYYWKYSMFTIIKKPIRKFFSAIIIPSIPFSSWRIIGYRLCGYKIGKNVFIGMRCYLDDMCYDNIYIGDNVIISYGVFVACHGRNQGHNTLEICEGAYIGMRASIIARTNIKIGRKAIIGACTLVNRNIPDNATAVGIPCKILEAKDK